jgi:predicted PurR-regulated permease PerM
LQQQDLRNRMIRLAGAHDLQRTTAAIDDAGQRLSRLFLTQLALNAGFGLVIGLGLWLIGVPSAPLWGILAMTLRFVPYIGAIISAIFPLLVAAAVGPGWSMVLWTAALFLIVEPIVGHVIEPMVYGQSSGLSPVAVVASATFWTWLWGPIGLVLATPLTVCLVVLGRHVEQLKFLEIMLGDRPALSPTEVTYQRMLAGDPMEAAEQAETFLKEQPLVSY